MTNSRVYVGYLTFLFNRHLSSKDHLGLFSVGIKFLQNIWIVGQRIGPITTHEMGNLLSNHLEFDLSFW